MRCYQAKIFFPLLDNSRDLRKMMPCLVRQTACRTNEQRQIFAMLNVQQAVEEMQPLVHRNPSRHDETLDFTRAVRPLRAAFCDMLPMTLTTGKICN